MIIASLLLARLALGAVIAGTVLRTVGGIVQRHAEQDQEDLRQRQMELESQRERRQAIRQGLINRSIAVANANAQGAQGGSALQGGLAQISGDTSRSIQATNQNEDIGYGLFAAKSREARGAGIANIGSGLSSLGGNVIQNLPTIQRVGGSSGN